MRKTLLCVALAVLAVGATACGDDSNTSAAQTFKVKVDGTSDKFNAAFLNFFPKQLAARPGDTVEFEEIWTGEPHTVTMGTLVDQNAKAAKANPDADPPVKLPDMISTDGPPAIVPSAAQACYLTTGTPPSDPKAACAKAAQPEFNGKQAYYNSGFLAANEKFNVKLAADTAPGQYTFYCNLHGLDMSGVIDVKAEGTEVPSPADVEKAGTAEKDALVAKVEPAVTEAKAGKFPFPGVKNVAGYGSEQAESVLVDDFIPAEINAKVGEKVVWTVIGPHTISFGKAPIEAGDWITKAADGTVSFNHPEIIGPTGFPPAPPPPNGPPPPGPPPAPTTVDGGTFDGSGFKSTGLVLSFPPVLVNEALAFTKAGTYSYVCLLHPKMGGVVKVT